MAGNVTGEVVGSSEHSTRLRVMHGLTAAASGVKSDDVV
jgi:hypothetical protein